MDLATLLKPASVRIVGRVSSKKRLFVAIAETASATLGIDAANAVDALIERENLGPTGVGKGVALPHARLDGLEEIGGVFLRLDRPLEFESVDRQPVDLIFALFAPRTAGVEHLKALALVSRTMRDPAVCAKLRANSDPAALHAILTETPASKAA